MILYHVYVTSEDRPLNPKSISSGNSVQTAYDEAQTIYAQNIQKMLAINSPTSMEVAANLYHDFTYHVLLGNPSAKITA